jgi:DNA-binding NarL/FixJ family response regulator
VSSGTDAPGGTIVAICGPLALGDPEAQMGHARARDRLGTLELEVVQLAAEGLSNPEIAGRLFMSRSTAKTHLSHVYTKLNIANRTELAAVTASRPEDR